MVACIYGHEIWQKSEELDHELPLYRQGNHLYVKENFWSKVEIKPTSETRFIGNSKQVGKFNMEFVMDRDGNVDYLMAYLGSKHFKPDTIKNALLYSASKAHTKLLADYNPHSPTTRVKYLVAHTFT